MNRFLLLAAAGALAGCAAIPEQEDVPRKEIVRDPAKIHGFFMRMIREDQPGVAELVTTLPQGMLTLALRNEIAPDLTRRLLLGFEQHEVRVEEDRSRATVRWCNREFGISREFRMVSQAGGRVWALDITRDQIEELAHAGIAWFKKQREVADGRIYAYPPDWVATPLTPRCPCEQGKKIGT